MKRQNEMSCLFHTREVTHLMQGAQQHELQWGNLPVSRECGVLGGELGMMTSFSAGLKLIDCAGFGTGFGFGVGFVAAFTTGSAALNFLFVGLDSLFDEIEEDDSLPLSSSPDEDELLPLLCFVVLSR